MNSRLPHANKLEQRTRECGREQEHQPAVADSEPCHALPRFERTRYPIGMLQRGGRLEHHQLALSVAKRLLRQDKGAPMPANMRHAPGPLLGLG